MDKNDRNEYLTKVNERIYEQLNFAETKNGIFSGILGAAIWGVFSAIDTGCLYLDIYLYIMGVSFSIALIFLLFTFYPNRKTLNGKGNLYFWGYIAQKSNARSYISEVEKDYDLLDEQLAEQNIQVSRIISRKHKIFTISIKFTIAGVLPLFYFYLVYKYGIKKILKKKNTE